MHPLPLIPYFQTTRYRVATMIALANVQPGEKAADLGCGDGRIVIALSQAGAEAHGYELDTVLVIRSQKSIKQNNINTAWIHQKNFWEEDLSVYSIITIYPMPDIMDELENKLRRELQPGARILLNYYPFPNWKSAKVKDSIYLYTT